MSIEGLRRAVHKLHAARADNSRCDSMTLFEPNTNSARSPFETPRRPISPESASFVSPVSKNAKSSKRADNVNETNWAVNFLDPDGHLLSIYGAR